jgi:ribosomal protein S19
MARSIKKGPFFEGPTRRSTILPHCAENTYHIHSGKQTFEVLVTPDMIGHKFGEFVRTRKKALHATKKSKR